MNTCFVCYEIFAFKKLSNLITKMTLFSIETHKHICVISCIYVIYVTFRYVTLPLAFNIGLYK